MSRAPLSYSNPETRVEVNATGLNVETPVAGQAPRSTPSPAY